MLPNTLLEMAAEADLFIWQAWSFDTEDATLLRYHTVVEQRHRPSLPAVGTHPRRATAEDGVVIEL